MGTAYTSAVATIPDPRTRDFLPWVSTLVSYRLAEAPTARTTTYYVAYDAAGDGTGGSGAGTEADPYLCATVDHIDTLYSSVASGGDVALLLKRGDEWTATATGIVMDIADTTIGAYGTGDKPRLWPPGTVYTSGWTQAGATDRYSATLFTEPGWLVIEGQETTTILSRQTATVDVTNTANSFFWNSAGNAIQLNVGGIDPNTLTVRTFDSGDLVGVQLSADGTRLDNVVTMGWGINPADTSNQAHGIKTTVSGTDAAVVTDCEAYYGSSHVLAHNVNASGGIATFKGCSAGLTQQNGSSGETVLNGYSSSGGGEYIFDACLVPFGSLPEGTAAYEKRAAPAYSHTATGTNAIVILRDITTSDGTHGCSGSARIANLPSAAAITDARGFIIGEDFTGPGGSNASGVSRTRMAPDDAVLINSRLNLTPVGSITVGALVNLPVSGWAINNVYDIDLSASTNTVFGWWNALASNPSDVKFWHCQFNVTGNSTTNTRFDFDATTQSDGAELKNSIISATGFSGGKTLTLNLGNNLVNSGNIDSNAYFGVTGSGDTTTDDGYGNDAGAVELSEAATLLARPTPAGQLYQAGADLDVNYDYYGSARTDTPEIGPLAAGGSRTRSRLRVRGRRRHW